CGVITGTTCRRCRRYRLKSPSRVSTTLRNSSSLIRTRQASANDMGTLNDKKAWKDNKSETTANDHFRYPLFHFCYPSKPFCRFSSGSSVGQRTHPHSREVGSMSTRGTTPTPGRATRGAGGTTLSP